MKITTNHLKTGQPRALRLPKTKIAYAKKTKRLRKAKVLVLALNLLLLVAAGTFITYDFGQASNRQQLSTASNPVAGPQPIDSLSSSDIAVNLARMSDLETAELIAYQADTQRQNLAVASGDNSNSTNKPLIVDTELKSRHDIAYYTTVEGDTVNGLAKKFGVTSNSIRWSNDLDYINLLSAGEELVIPPVNGIIYTVEAGDTAENLAARFNSDADHIIAFNDAEISGLPTGELIVIPGGEKATPRRTSYYSSFYGSSGLCGSESAQVIKRVERGEQIGVMGTTGRSSGVHLHLAMCDYAGGSYIDPNVGVCQRGTPISSEGCDVKYGFGWPVPNRNNNYISRGFTGYHRGLDIVGSSPPIIAVEDGDIIACGRTGAGGYSVVISHDNGIVTTYMHMAPGTLRC